MSTSAPKGGDMNHGYVMFSKVIDATRCLHRKEYGAIPMVNGQLYFNRGKIKEAKGLKHG